MKISLLAAFILLTLTLTTHAQSTTTDEACTEAAQEWYDAIKAGDLEQAFVDSVTSSNGLRARVDAVDVFRDTATQAEVDEDVCFAVAAGWYIEALERYADALDEFIDGETTNYSINSIKAFILIGQMRGYLTLLDVELFDPEDNPIYFK